MASEKSVKMLHSEDRKEPRKTQNRANNIVQELSEKWPKGRKETHSNAKEPCKSGKTTTTKTVTKDRQPGERRLQQSP